ncbi:MAG: hypothetical protein Q7O66_14275, partial [Dehalococcoidia bacterium]|nr:hypothetical protein [Dehalococcoidia bacterium]
PQTVQVNSLVLREVSLIGTYCYNASDSRRDYRLAIDIASGTSGNDGIELERIITHQYRLSEIQWAFDTAVDKSTGVIKVVVAP